MISFSTEAARYMSSSKHIKFERRKKVENNYN
ncbi:hypothetical protein I3842_08G115400 [Carya illinoinensis]|uniref:Uncharacterized protein n=1 Tax=Carya illinoinensis TaxID=32201 RepID=A0A922JA30_CARIL|nr:hypothetical protein I3842_08G115400 [Carya illinoinensis]